jgi:GTPase SAR1 family protein
LGAAHICGGASVFAKYINYIILMLNNSSIAEEESLMTPYKIIILGKGNTGKTKLLVRYIYGSYTDTGVMTMMIDCSYKKRKNVRYAYYDTAGQHVYRTVLGLHLKGSDAAMLIYSVNDMESFK